MSSRIKPGDEKRIRELLRRLGFKKLPKDQWEYQDERRTLFCAPQVHQGGTIMVRRAKIGTGLEFRMREKPGTYVVVHKAAGVLPALWDLSRRYERVTLYHLGKAMIDKIR